MPIKFAVLPAITIKQQEKFHLNEFYAVNLVGSLHFEVIRKQNHSYLLCKMPWWPSKVVFRVKFAKFLRTPFYRTPPVAASRIQYH